MTSAGPPGVARAAFLVARRDLRGELRTRTATQGVGFYALLTVLLFSFALGPDSETLRDLAPGLLWLALALASLLPAARNFAGEQEQQTLEGLLLYPVAHEALFLGKLAATFIVLVTVAAVSFGLMSLLYTLPAPDQAWLLLAGVPLGALGLAAAGAFYGAVGADLRAREALIPMLVLPGLVPLLIGATRVVEAALTGGDGLRWLGLLAAFDVLLIVLSATVVPYVFER